MKTRTARHIFSSTARALAVVAFFVGPLAGYAMAKDNGVHGPSGAGLVLYVSLLRGR